MQYKKQSGFGLVEIIVAIGIFVTLASTAVVVILHSFNSNRLGENQTEATLLSEEGIETVRALANQDWNNLSAGTYGIGNTGGSLSLTPNPTSIGIFSRQVNITELDVDRYEVIASTSWNFSPTRSNSVDLKMFLTNFKKLLPLGGDWSAPAQAGSLDLSGNNEGIRIQLSANYAYILLKKTSPDFIVVDISNPSLPTQLGTLDISDQPNDLSIAGNYAYIATDSKNDEFQVIDISNPNSPSVVSSINLSKKRKCSGVTSSDNYAYLVCNKDKKNDEFFIINVSSPTSPSQAGSLDLGDTGNAVAIDGSFAYVASSDKNQELQVVSISNANSPSLSSSLDLAGKAAGSAVDAGDGVALIGRDDGELAIINISNPTSPTIISTFDAGGAISDLRYDSSSKLAFLATSEKNSEFQVVDLTNPSSPVLFGSLDLGADLRGIDFDQDLNHVGAVGSDKGAEFLILNPG